MEVLSIYTNSNEIFTYFNSMNFKHMKCNSLGVKSVESNQNINVLIVDLDEEIEEKFLTYEYEYIFAFGKGQHKINIKNDLLLSNIDGVKGVIKLLYYFISDKSVHYIGTEFNDMLAALHNTTASLKEIGYSDNLSKELEVLLKPMKKEQLKGLWVVEKLKNSNPISLIEIFNTVEQMEDLMDNYNQGETSAFYFPFINAEENNDKDSWVYIFTGK